MKSIYFYIALLLSTVSFFIVDCSAGNNGCTDATISDHKYVEPWTEVETTYYTDSEGESHPTVTTTYHPEEWHVFCVSVSGQEFDVLATHQ